MKRFTSPCKHWTKHNFAGESPNYTHCVHIYTNPALNFPYLFSLTLHSASIESIAERRRRTRGRRLWSILFLILSFQIKGWFVFKLTKSSNGPRQRANTLKCLSRSICVMGQSSVSVCVYVCVLCVLHCIVFCHYLVSFSFGMFIIILQLFVLVVQQQ